ncbi:bifunctional purine biosynthesis protein, putative [Perkinsus marinus ATCC 50983]|uniref:Bifunctional purine biosynthesis protein, putative n=1 Tax=Perkinsus marinus (strain ATCC 50983 / TXsc) TaxID=423536 RepID=C5L910_PERM5|nr:bifunctional purine biosynthesis protein, putative [Perkinsus marinus ATCC 50983]EER06774.1 bifunctional purine biosynthesis protein, putative [Perkinsus marinus ATCC 50983]|eukprot:XP_002774958.1 bifunctional purine biosynthesis protein, putative [Perkinsus marinus ATCC 50983]
MTSANNGILGAVSGAGKASPIVVKTALVSVYDKTGLDSLGKCLASYGVKILSTGGTAKKMKDLGCSVMDVSEYTGSPEILDGRVKTLHPKVHGALLAVRGNESHERQLVELGIEKIDLVVVNLYPFEDAVASMSSDFSACIENIDIGGPCMIRAAAKNSHGVCILTSTADYDELARELAMNKGSTTPEFRRRMACKAFALTARYDSKIAAYMSSVADSTETLAGSVTQAFDVVSPLKYGCNPHQQPAAMCSVVGNGGAMPFKVLNGTPGYINLLDAINSWMLVREMDTATGLPSAASFKHVSPAGAAVASAELQGNEASIYEVAPSARGNLTPVALAYIRSRNGDPMCSFGDFVAVSRTVDVSLASLLKSDVSDGIIAPGYEPEAYEILKAKKGGKFVILHGDTNFVCPEIEVRSLGGLGLLQKRNDIIFDSSYLQNIVTKASTSFTQQQIIDLIVCSIAVKYTQSNSVGFCKDGMMIGIGAGQQSRVDCVKLAARKVQNWWHRQHPKVLGMKFKSSVKKQARVNARVRYIEGDMSELEYTNWKADNFDPADVPEPLSDEEKAAFMKTLTGVAVSSDAFFPFRDSIDVCSRYGVTSVVQPGGSVADAEVIEACDQYSMTMAFSSLRLFHH